MRWNPDMSYQIFEKTHHYICIKLNEITVIEKMNCHEHSLSINTQFQAHRIVQFP